MHREAGVVVEVSGGQALVESEATSFCASCEARDTCRGGEGKKRRIWIRNGPGAEKGDCVIYEIRERDVVLSSVLLYLFPVASLIGGSAAGYTYHEMIGLDRDLGAGVFGIGGLIVSFALVWTASKIFMRRGVFAANMVEIQKKSG